MKAIICTFIHYVCNIVKTGKIFFYSSKFQKLEFEIEYQRGIEELEFM